MKSIRLSSLVSVAMLTGLCSASLPASILGTFNIAGSITVTNGAPDVITWTSTGNLANQADVGPGSTGIFAGVLNSGDLVSIQNLSRTTEPVASPFPPQPFIGFTPPALSDFDISFIFQGFYTTTDCAAAPVPGQTCSLANSPFNFVNNPPAPGQATATFAFTGLTADGQNSWRGNFTSQFSVPFQTVLDNLGTDGFVTNTFSATFTLETGVPEPGPMILVVCGLGLILISAVRRRSSGRLRN